VSKIDRQIVLINTNLQYILYQTTTGKTNNRTQFSIKTISFSFGMTSSQPLPSSFRTRAIPSNKIRYTLADRPNTVDRDYGLMRIPAMEGSTPHPRLTLRVDDNINQGTTTPEGNIHKYSSSIHFDKKTSHRLQRAPPEHTLIGTPHPSKGLALDPQLLRKDYMAKRERLSMIRDSFDAGLISKPPSILKNHLGLDHSNSYCKKKPGAKVILIDPKKSVSLTTLSSQEPSTSLSELHVTFSFQPTCKNRNLSFAERRRLFHEAEFTIAKNGNKMSNHIMPVPRHTLVFVESEIARKDKKAINEIKEYIRNHGYTMSHCAVTNTFSITHRTSN